MNPGAHPNPAHLPATRGYMPRGAGGAAGGAAGGGAQRAARGAAGGDGGSAAAAVQSAAVVADATVSVVVGMYASVEETQACVRSDVQYGTAVRAPGGE